MKEVLVKGVLLGSLVILPMVIVTCLVGIANGYNAILLDLIAVLATLWLDVAMILCWYRFWEDSEW